MSMIMIMTIIMHLAETRTNGLTVLEEPAFSSGGAASRAASRNWLP